MKEQFKKSFWQSTSPKFLFIFGIITGIAAVGLISFVVFGVVTLNQSTNLAGGLAQLGEQKIENIEADLAPEELPAPSAQPTEPVVIGQLASFDEVEGQPCFQDGKPVIRLFTTTWCSHCTWIKDTFDAVVKEYVKSGKIVAYHWELDTGDDTLTEAKESQVPVEEEDAFMEFNPYGSIPSFVFGCKYIRVGTAHERDNDLEAEAADFRAIIEELLK